MSLTDAAFLREGLGSDAPAPRELAQRLAEDEEYRARTLGDRRAFDAVLAHDEALSAVSPRLFFEILLRRAVLDLQGARYTVERSGLAAQRAGGDGLREVFHTLGAHVAEAKKPINFLSEHYVGFRRERLFGAG